MPQDNTTTRKRKRSDGPAMPHLREVVDGETGEVYHVETTRQAKRRHKLNGGGQWQPTEGQINAADIWNRQEAKIKKDKENAERRKKSKARELAQEARRKEIQQEDLQKGRISIEDTWAKVNPSQNRLHKFFGPPLETLKKSLFNIEKIQEKACTEDDVKSNVNNNFTLNACKAPEDQDIFSVQDFEDIFTSSPLSPNEKVRARHEDLNTRHNTKTSVKRKCSQLSQNSQEAMPPPKRRLRPSSSKTANSEVDARSPERARPVSPAAKSEGSGLLSATQVVRDVLMGLCSQDLADDFLESNKEDPPLSSQQGFKPEQPSELDEGIHNATVVERRPDDFLDELSDTECCGVLDNFESDAFDDGGLDDETLLALAATHQLTSELEASSKYDGKADDNKTPSKPNIGHCTPFSNTNEPMSDSKSKLSDSFAMDGLNDEDLLEGLQNFENANKTVLVDHTNHNSELPRSTRKSRALPWIKFPINYSQKDVCGCDETASPCASNGRSQG